jgi:hypothetical protein
VLETPKGGRCGQPKPYGDSRLARYWSDSG